MNLVLIYQDILIDWLIFYIYPVYVHSAGSNWMKIFHLLKVKGFFDTFTLEDLKFKIISC
jgi:hypothetical protein